jgi:ankyrin repeat protein
MDQDPQVLGNQLVKAARDGNNETIKALLMQCVSVDTKDNAGWTPLMFASANNHVAVCVLFLTHKAYVDAKDYYDRTPLMGAAVNGRNHICELLLTYRAHVDTKDKNGDTPLMLAAAYGCKDVCELLLNHGAQIDAINNHGDTPFMWASINGHKDVCKLLLEYNARVGARNNAGDTPLMWAASEGHVVTCKWLIDIMIQKQHKFTKNWQAIISFLGMRKKNGCLRLIGHDMVLCIARMVFNMAKKDNVHIVEQINAIKNNALKTELLNYYQTQLRILQGAQPKEYRE